MELKRIATITRKERAEHKALLEEQDALTYQIAKHNIKHRTFLQSLCMKYNVPRDTVYTIKANGIFTNG